MKKYLIVLTCIVLCFATACSTYPNSDIGVNTSGVCQEEITEDVVTNKYYRIYKTTPMTLSYDIYDSDGNVVLSETTDKPLAINMLNADIIDIGIEMGTGITLHKYYSVDQNVSSGNFSYVLANFNELVAYIAVPKEQSFANRRIVIQNVFDKGLFYKEYELDLAKVDTPVTQASFSSDGLSLHLIYLSGPNQETITQTLPLD